MKFFFRCVKLFHLSEKILFREEIEEKQRGSGKRIARGKKGLAEGRSEKKVFVIKIEIKSRVIFRPSLKFVSTSSRAKFISHQTSKRKEK